LPQGAELITPEQTQERMRTAFDRASAFLRLTALLSALLAGVAIALAAQRYARRKTAEVACCARWAPRAARAGPAGDTLAALAIPAAAWAAMALGLSQLAWLFRQSAVRQRADRAAAGSVVRRRGDGHCRADRLCAAAAGTRLAEVPPVAVFRQSMERRVRRFDALYLIPLLVALALIWSAERFGKLAGILAAACSAWPWSRRCWPRCCCSSPDASRPARIPRCASGWLRWHDGGR
jgi:putative ABC transport system permease protein